MLASQQHRLQWLGGSSYRGVDSGGGGGGRDNDTACGGRRLATRNEFPPFSGPKTTRCCSCLDPEKVPKRCERWFCFVFLVRLRQFETDRN